MIFNGYLGEVCCGDEFGSLKKVDKFQETVDQQDYKMKKMKLIFLAFWVVLLVVSVDSQIVQNWSSALSSATLHSTFACQANVGQKIGGHIQADASNYYLIQLYRPGEYNPMFPAFDIIYANGSTGFASKTLDAAGYWRLEIVPMNSSQMFVVQVSLFVDDTFVGNYVDIARYSKVFVIYQQTGNLLHFNISDVFPQFISQISVDVKQGGSDLSYAGGGVVYHSDPMSSSSDNITILIRNTGYYFLTINADPAILGSFPRIAVKYQSDLFPCPFSSVFADSSRTFSSCVQLNYPNACKIVNSKDNTCSKCSNDYVLQNGNCYKWIQCKQNQYFHLGACQLVVPNCALFEYIGGLCLICKKGYQFTVVSAVKSCMNSSTSTTSIVQPLVLNQSATLPVNQTATNGSNSGGNIQNNSTSVNKTNNSNSGNTNNQTSINNLNNQTNVTGVVVVNNEIKGNEKNCSRYFYLKNGLCYSFPQNCIEFDDENQICTQCLSGYTLNDYRYSCIQSKIVCKFGFVNINNKCIAIPSNCQQANSFGQCRVCYAYYTVYHGYCIPKNCNKNQYMDINEGICKVINPLCSNFSKQGGMCISCKSGYGLTSNGECILNTISFPSSSSDCQPKQYKINNICFNVDPLCGNYNLDTGSCITCIDYNRVVDDKGKCVLVIQICQSGTFYSFNKKSCIAVSPYCLKSDPLGACTNCQTGYLAVNGTCVSYVACSPQTYLDSNGNCVAADPTCLTFNQKNGECLTCIIGFELNEGKCCYALNYLNSAVCVPFLKQNCLVQRPNFGNCEQCALGYALTNGVFGKCQPIS